MPEIIIIPAVFYFFFQMFQSLLNYRLTNKMVDRSLPADDIVKLIPQKMMETKSFNFDFKKIAYVLIIVGLANLLFEYFRYSYAHRLEQAFSDRAFDILESIHFSMLVVSAGIALIFSSKMAGKQE